MNKGLLSLLPLLALLVTGCPHNEYIVELKPHGDKLKRKLVFYSDDDSHTNRVPEYLKFSEEELAIISNCYPPGVVTNQEGRYVAESEFVGSMPADVGGVGAYSNLVTSMGSAGFYLERFRGTDDLATLAEKRLALANQLVDILVDWSETELGIETNYAALRKFLDEDFRRDVKNATLYWKMTILESEAKTNIWEQYEKYGVPFGQYLLERGYFQGNDLPRLFLTLGDNTDTRLMAFIQRLVARKLGVQDSQPLPTALAFLRDSETMTRSFEKYCINSKLYRNKLREWENKHTATEPKPGAAEITREEFSYLFEINWFVERDDHLVVKLTLPVSPTRSNGKWDAAAKQVVWNSDLQLRTNSVWLPVLCYANWAQPDEGFQKQHFGRVILIGDDLTGYALWRATLNEKQGTEWDRMLAGLQPGKDLVEKIQSFRLADEPTASAGQDEEKNPGYLGRAAIENALNGKSLQGQPSEASQAK